MFVSGGVVMGSSETPIWQVIEETAAKLKKQHEEMNTRQESLDRKEQELNSKQGLLDEKERGLNAKESSLNELQSVLTGR